MELKSSKYGFRIRIEAPFEQAVERVTATLKEQGFGVLTEIDVQKTLREKLGVEFRRYVILGACNPELAREALSAELEVGLLLPCNVVVHEADGGGSVVAAVDPDVLLGVVPNPALGSVSKEATRRLHRALEALGG